MATYCHDPRLYGNTSVPTLVREEEVLTTFTQHKEQEVRMPERWLLCSAVQQGSPRQVRVADCQVSGGVLPS